MAHYLQGVIFRTKFCDSSILPISTYRNSAAHKARGLDSMLFEQIQNRFSSLIMTSWRIWEKKDEVHYLACYQSAMLYPTTDPKHVKLLLDARSEYCPQAYYHLGILRVPTDVNDAIGCLTNAYENKNASNDIRRDAGFKLGELWESKIPFWTFYSTQAERDAIAFKNKAISFYEASAKMGHEGAQVALDRLQGVRTSGIVHTSNAEEQKQRERAVKQFFSL